MAREIEVKYLVDGLAFANLRKAMIDILKDSMMAFEEGTYIDSYFKTDGASKFIRFSFGTKDAIVTAKVNDKGTTTDRREFNVPVAPEHRDEMVELLTAAMGDPVAILWKFFEFKMNDATISVVQNLEKPEWLLLEVEGIDFSNVQLRAKLIEAAIPGVSLKQVKNSMFDIFVNKQGVVL